MLDRVAVAVAPVILAVAVVGAGWATTQEEAPMSPHRAIGTFEVTRTPQSGEQHPGGVTLGRDRLEKRFNGDLDGVASGEMLTALTAVQGSAGYVAIEHMTGTLHGLAGGFVLQHSGLLSRGDPSLVIAIVPDSGSGELEGIAGTMTVTIEEGRHAYELEYTLTASPGR